MLTRLTEISQETASHDVGIAVKGIMLHRFWLSQRPDMSLNNAIIYLEQGIEISKKATFKPYFRPRVSV